MDVFGRLSRLGTTLRNRALPIIWQTAVPKLKYKLQRLVDAWAWSEKARSWVASHPNLAFAPIGVFGVIYLLRIQQAAAAAALAGAWFALARHFSQTEADRRRRISESYSKAVEQLGSDKLEVRLGGIFSLERISKESPDEYWTVMENLSAFVRERSRRNEAEQTSLDLEQCVSRCAYSLWQRAGQPSGRAEEFWAEAVKSKADLGERPPADIAAVLTVIKRRSKESREREAAMNWSFDLSGAILTQADLRFVDLRRANLSYVRLAGAQLEEAHLEEANLMHADLKSANLFHAHLEHAELRYACLKQAYVWDARLDRTSLDEAHLEQAELAHSHFEGAALWGTYLNGANLRNTQLQRADLQGAHLEGANLEGATLNVRGNLQLLTAHGDAFTRLPNGVDRPTHWASTA
jgi:uncharacterized protein YjbI with pentapeptide repeats